MVGVTHTQQNIHTSVTQNHSWQRSTTKKKVVILGVLRVVTPRSCSDAAVRGTHTHPQGDAHASQIIYLPASQVMSQLPALHTSDWIPSPVGHTLPQRPQF